MSQASRNDRLDADAKPAIGVTPDGTAQSEGHEEHGEHHDDPIHQGLPHVQPGQQFGQDDQEAGPQDRPEQ